MNRQLGMYLEEYIQEFSLTNTESEQARENLAVVTSGYFRGRDPKLIAWTACNMVLKRRRDGSDYNERSESLGFDPKKVAQIEWRIVKAQTNRGEMPPDKKSEWVEFEIKDIYGHMLKEENMHISRLKNFIFILNSIQDDVDVMEFSPHSIASSIIWIELNSSAKIFTSNAISKLTNVPEKDISESKPIVRLAWEQSPKYIPPEFGPQD
ncbi:MAG: hypothetical protein HOM19_06915 [Candidatus Marinimicrobia bacterium]|jgi:hypothetical protein|nr:hypothetical protein [Candidatus Neomarinimicrobiota bacterium]